MSEKFNPDQNNESLEDAYNKNLEESLKLASDFNTSYHRNTTNENMDQSKLIDEKIRERVELLNKNGNLNIEDISNIKFSKEEMAHPLSRSIETESKIKSFLYEALNLVRTLGFEGEVKKNWLKLKMGNLEFAIAYSPVPGRNGEFLRRIRTISARLNDNRISLYMDTWFQACEDKETQMKLDLIIATLR